MKDGRVVTIICGGDQLSVERMGQVRMNNCVDDDIYNTGEGLKAMPAEFLKWNIFLQV